MDKQIHNRDFGDLILAPTECSPHVCDLISPVKVVVATEYTGKVD